MRLWRSFSLLGVVEFEAVSGLKRCVLADRDVRETFFCFCERSSGLSDCGCGGVLFL